MQQVLGINFTPAPLLGGIGSLLQQLLCVLAQPFLNLGGAVAPTAGPNGYRMPISARWLSRVSAVGHCRQRLVNEEFVEQAAAAVEQRLQW